MWLICPNCGAQGELREGQAVPARVNCPACGATFEPLPVAEQLPGVIRPAWPAATPPVPPPVVLVRVGPAAPVRACAYCGEAILPAARKCRHCGEYLDPTLRAEEARRLAPLPAPQVVIHNAPSASANAKADAKVRAKGGGCGCLVLLLLLLVALLAIA